MGYSSKRCDGCGAIGLMERDIEFDVETGEKIIVYTCECGHSEVED